MADFSNIKLNLPVNSSGGFTGTCMTIFPVPSSFQYPPYFTHDEETATFNTPVKSAKTSSKTFYGRTECRAMNGSKEEAVDVYTVLYWVLQRTCRIDFRAVLLDKSLGDCIVGQIHGPDDEPCRLYSSPKGIYFANDKSGSKKKEVKFYLVDAEGNKCIVPDGQFFTYTIEVKNKVLAVTVAYDGVVYAASDKIISWWKGKLCYHKWGLYLPVSDNPKAGHVGIGSAQVTFMKWW